MHLLSGEHLHKHLNPEFYPFSKFQKQEESTQLKQTNKQKQQKNKHTGLFLFEALLEYHVFQPNKVSSLLFLSSITFDIATKVDLHKTMEQNNLTVIGSRPSSTLQVRKLLPKVSH